MINWNRYKDRAGQINLVDAYKGLVKQPDEDAIKYLNRVTALQPIYSRQIAASILAMVTFDEEFFND